MAFQIQPDIFSGLILVQNVGKDHQQMICFVAGKLISLSFNILVTLISVTRPRCTVSNVSCCRYLSDCRFRGHESYPSPVPYFRGDLSLNTVKSRLSEHRLSETTGLFEDDGQSRLFSLLSIAIKLPIIRISIIRKIQFFEAIRRSRLKKFLLNNPSRFEVQNVTHGDHDFFVWTSSIYTPE